MKQLPLSVRMVRGVPLSEQIFVENYNLIPVSVGLQTCADGRLLRRSLATKTHTSLRLLDLIGFFRLRILAYLLPYYVFVF